MPSDDHTILQVSLPRSTARHLEQVATQKGMSAADLAREVVERMLANEPVVYGDRTPRSPGTEVGYRWKNVFLPEGTVLSFTHRGTPYLATVTGTELVHDGKSVSPSEFVNGISGATRNAWRDLWVRRPADTEWVPAQDLRKAATETDVMRQIGSSAGAAALAAIPLVSAGAIAGGAVAVTALAGLLGRRRRFGSLPISERMGPRYLQACRAVLRIFETRATGEADLEQISEAKGMFNRIVKQDRHDWQHVQQMLGMPDRPACVQAVMWLGELRSLAKGASPVKDHLARPAASLVEGNLRKAMLELEELGFGEMTIGPLDNGDDGDERD
jgi:hypothetical protein